MINCRKRQVADGTTTSLTLALPQLSETDVHKCHSSGQQKCGSVKGKDLGCSQDVFQSNLRSLCLTKLALWGWTLCKRMIPYISIPGHFDFIVRHSFCYNEFCVFLHPLPPIKEPQLSTLLCLLPFSMLDEHIFHYTHLQRNNETTVQTCAFLLPNRWQYCYIITVLSTFERHMFYGGVKFSYECPFLYNIKSICLEK